MIKQSLLFFILLSPGNPLAAHSGGLHQGGFLSLMAHFFSSLYQVIPTLLAVILAIVFFGKRHKAAKQLRIDSA